ncbi:MAG: BatD family protein [Gammaproteobacteria bacterium]
MVARILNSLLVVIGLLLATSALAQDISLQAVVDRSVVQENESFTYLLRAQGSTREEPDLSPLAAEFDILQRSRNTSIQMAGGQTIQTTEWNLQLMPREPGTFTLPPIILAGSLSNPVEIEVTPAPDTAAAGDIFIEVAATPGDPYVQSQVVYTMTLYRGVSTGRSSLTLPEVSGGEAIIEKLGQDREFQTLFEGRSFIALERRYAIFPQASGTMTIDPVTFEAVVVSPSGFSNVQRYRSDSVELSVRSAVPPPPAFADAAWLPAQSLSIDERWSSTDNELTSGVPQTRTLTIDALGVLETQLPDLEIPQSDDIRQYGDQPEMAREPEQDGLRSRRIERFAVLAQSPGSHVLPEVELPWFDVTNESWQVASVPARSLVVLPGSDPVALTSEPIVSEEAQAPTDASSSRIWQGVSAGLFVLWLATLAFALRARQPMIAPQEKAADSPPTRSTNRRLLRRIREACEKNDGSLARRLLLEWGEVRFPDDAPKSLGALATLLPESLALPISDLERDLYGPESEEWDGQALRAAIKNVDSVDRGSDITSGDGLLPLYR